MGEVDVDALLARISSRQISEWMMYYRLEPFGEAKADLRTALLASLIANANRDPKQRSEPYRVEEFMGMLQGGEEGEEGEHPEMRGGSRRGWTQTWQEQKARLMALTNGKR